MIPDGAVQDSPPLGRLLNQVGKDHGAHPGFCHGIGSRAESMKIQTGKALKLFKKGAGIIALRRHHLNGDDKFIFV
jgi:hypothetical protein